MEKEKNKNREKVKYESNDKGDFHKKEMVIEEVTEEIVEKNDGTLDNIEKDEVTFTDEIKENIFEPSASESDSDDSITIWNAQEETIESQQVREFIGEEVGAFDDIEADVFVEKPANEGFFTRNQEEVQETLPQEEVQEILFIHVTCFSWLGCGLIVILCECVGW